MLNKEGIDIIKKIRLILDTSSGYWNIDNYPTNEAKTLLIKANTELIFQYTKFYDLLDGNKSKNQMLKSCLHTNLNNVLSLDIYDYEYPTFLNSTFIKTKNNKNILLVPRYKNFRNLESEIEKIYQGLYPYSEIIFVNSDFLISDHGAVHCITNYIPSYNKFSNSLK